MTVSIFPYFSFYALVNRLLEADESSSTQLAISIQKAQTSCYQNAPKSEQDDHQLCPIYSARAQSSCVLNFLWAFCSSLAKK